MREKMKVSVNGGTLFEVPIIRKFSAFGFDFAVHHALPRSDDIADKEITLKKTFTVSEISTGRNIVYGYEFDRGPEAQSYGREIVQKNGPEAISEAIDHYRDLLKLRKVGL